MTFSLLARDENSGALVAAAATGSLCVGGWVIRGALNAGLVASQGTAPSTFWRDGVLTRMQGGETAEAAVEAVTSADPKRGHRQLSALGLGGAGAGFTGAESVSVADTLAWENGVCAGNMLANANVLPAMREAWDAEGDDPAQRALAVLRAAEHAGGDARGLTSAAMLVLRPDAPPLDLRIDLSETPLDDLGRLLRAARSSPYADWLDVVPVAENPHRGPDEAPQPEQAILNGLT
jgi:uncharacterized Ntn-hydrolase superfamily protein